MNPLILSLFAAGCASLSNLFFRKNAEKNLISSDSSGYLILFYFISLVFSFLRSPYAWNSNVNVIFLAIGACVGLLNSILMLLTARALTHGPTNLTFAFQNASAIFPGLILFVCLGSTFGFSCSYLQLMGMIIVLCGLFLGAQNKSSNSLNKPSYKWLKYALGCFVIQILALTVIQGRCLLLSYGETGGLISNINITPADDVWFMFGQFGTSFVLQLAIFLLNNNKLKKSEIVYGSLGGIANLSSTCLLLLATKIALPWEKGILFPCFAVTSMILCNIWANRIYNEKLNIKTNALCSLGIFMAVAN